MKDEEILVENLKKLTDSVNRMAKVVERVEDKKYLKMVDHPAKFLLFSFLQGAFVALGSSIGLVIVLGILIYILKSLQFIPILGDFTDKIIPFLKRY